jgi:hypothetical protein
MQHPSSTLIMVSAIASYLPTYRANRIEPAISPREARTSGAARHPVAAGRLDRRLARHADRKSYVLLRSKIRSVPDSGRAILDA